LWLKLIGETHLQEDCSMLVVLIRLPLTFSFIVGQGGLALWVLHLKHVVALDKLGQRDNLVLLAAHEICFEVLGITVGRFLLNLLHL